MLPLSNAEFNALMSRRVPFVAISAPMFVSPNGRRNVSADGKKPGIAKVWNCQKKKVTSGAYPKRRLSPAITGAPSP
jgi:hypothetical protein